MKILLKLATLNECFKMKKDLRVGIIGGGVSGAVTALQLSELGIQNFLFEKKESLVSGPPFCHLHAGGNLYPEIPLEECKTLLKQSIEMARLLPDSIDKRPTFIAIPSDAKYSVDYIVNRLHSLTEYYQELVFEDPQNQILGPVDEYFKVYHEDDLAELSKSKTKAVPHTSDEWMRNAIEVVDISLLKKPIILVQEYGWNFFRVAAQAQLALKKSDYCDLNLSTTIVGIEDVSDNTHFDCNWLVRTNKETFEFDFLVNSAGYKNSEFEETLDLQEDRHVEFKASYVSKWKNSHGLIPEIVIHGERGTPHGMVQLTPYSDDYYQIHGMTQDITLFDGGLLKLDKENSKVKFNSNIQKILDNGWGQSVIDNRTQRAIDLVTRFIPTFNNATVGGPPLFGAQQIPGKNPDLRVGEVSFPHVNYARSEIVKASSALTVANQIISHLGLTHNPETYSGSQVLESVNPTDLNIKAIELAASRNFPTAMAGLLVKKVLEEVH